MRTKNQIEQMFRDMNLGTKEKRAEFNFSYFNNDLHGVNETHSNNHMDKSHKVKGDKNAELE